MATTELSGHSDRHAQPNRWPPAGLVRATLRMYTAIWTITLASASAVRLAGEAARRTARGLLGLALHAHATPTPSVGHALALTAHNIPIAAWPLLLGVIGPSEKRAFRVGADAILLACLCANTLPVGVALGGYGSPLLAYIPQLPVEYAGLAVGYGSWIVQRQRALTRSARLRWLTLLSVLLVCAALIETYAVPHSAKRNTPMLARRAPASAGPWHTGRQPLASAQVIRSAADQGAGRATCPPVHCSVQYG